MGGYKGNSTPRTTRSGPVTKPIKKKLRFTPSLTRRVEATASTFKKFLVTHISLIISLVLISSIFFTVFMGRQNYTSMKYESLKYGSENSAWRGLEIIDQESGEMLGGKRAAIQYYYNVKYGQEDRVQRRKEAMINDQMS